MANFLREYFHYTRSERNGLFVLAAICVALVLAPIVFKQFFNKSGSMDFSHFQNQIDSFYQKNDRTNEPGFQDSLFVFDPNTTSKEDFIKLGLSEKVASTIENYRNKGGKFFKKEDLQKIYGLAENDYDRLKGYILFYEDNEKINSEANKPEVETKIDIELFEFDPNTVSKADLLRLGLSKKVVKIMMNYRKKGGTFRKREDLSKIYGITEDGFERLFPYIKIVENQTTKVLASNVANTPQSYEIQTYLKIEINTASVEDWQKLRGIGSAYSKKICGFRDKLGGFVSIDQVAQTYGLPDSTFQKIKPFLVLKEPVKKINLNTAPAKELAAHPFLKWNQANAIVKYREQHGNFTSPDQLKNIKILNPETLQKIMPYLKVE